MNIGTAAGVAALVIVVGSQTIDLPGDSRGEQILATVTNGQDWLTNDVRGDRKLCRQATYGGVRQGHIPKKAQPDLIELCNTRVKKGEPKPAEPVVTAPKPAPAPEPQPAPVTDKPAGDACKALTKARMELNALAEQFPDPFKAQILDVEGSDAMSAHWRKVCGA